MIDIPRIAIRFFIGGLPKPAGSKRAFIVKNKLTQVSRAVVVDDCKTSRDWKTDVKHAAEDNYGGLPLLDCALDVTFHFIMPRPVGHYRTGNNRHLLRDSAPEFPTTRPDVLKLARAIEDALTKIIWMDDAQIVDEHITKRYGDRPGVEVIIEPKPTPTRQNENNRNPPQR